tara:strand:- start:26 stop:283 length:258 start_codon:yes stop_codon:yes gene_type:complete
MILRQLGSFKKAFKKLPPEIQKQFDKKLKLFVKNPRHPSLKVKKMEDPRNIWEGRITYSYRFTFQVEGNTLIFRKVGTHDILQNP